MFIVYLYIYHTQYIYIYMYAYMYIRYVKHLRWQLITKDQTRNVTLPNVIQVPTANRRQITKNSKYFVVAVTWK